MRISLFFALLAVLALLAAGCGGGANDGNGVALSQGQAGTSVSSGDMGKDIALTTYPTVTGTGGTLPGITVIGSGTARPAFPRAIAKPSPLRRWPRITPVGSAMAVAAPSARKVTLRCWPVR